MAELSKLDFNNRLLGMFNLLPHNQYFWSELVRGAHATLQDKGLYYDCWRSNYPCIPRISSHYQNGSINAFLDYGHVLFQYEIGPLFIQGFRGWLLFGLVPRSRNTWFQLEAHSGNFFNFLEIVEHLKDYIRSINTPVPLQYGPGGTSRCTDRQFLQIHMSDNLPINQSLFDVPCIPCGWGWTRGSLLNPPFE